MGTEISMSNRPSLPILDENGALRFSLFLFIPLLWEARLRAMVSLQRILIDPLAIKTFGMCYTLHSSVGAPICRGDNRINSTKIAGHA